MDKERNGEYDSEMNEGDMDRGECNGVNRCLILAYQYILCASLLSSSASIDIVQL